MYALTRKRIEKERENTIILRKLASLPLGFLALLLCLCMTGFMALYSASGGQFDPWASRQFIHFLIAIPVMLCVAIIDIRFWFQMAYVMYAGGIVLLLLVHVMGVEGGLGAQRWLDIGGFRFQPSEIMKVCLVAMLARYFHTVHSGRIRELKILIIPLTFVAIAVGLVLKQPNLGTGSILFGMSMMVFFAAGVSWKKFAIAGVLFLSALPLVWNFYMHDYQKQRVYTFLNPEADPLGAGYNIIQSKIAVGSGGIAGKGLTQGTQGRLSFVPEKQTDFIFSIIAEEFGFLGSLTILCLYGMLILHAMYIASRSRNLFGALMAYGVISILFLHVFINMGMVMGILPVVGVPLPLLSYGGSSLVSTIAGFGFIINAYVHRDVEF